jgi:hypothetical protein
MILKRVNLVIFILSFFLCNLAKAQSKRIIKWTEPKVFNFSKNISVTAFNFENCSHDGGQDYMPIYSERIPLPDGNVNVDFTITDAVYQNVAPKDQSLVSRSINSEITPDINIVTYRKISAAWVSFIPIRKNQSTGLYEQLVSFTITKVNKAAKYSSASVQRYYAPQSVLATGKWYKVAVTTDGIFKMSYSFLKNQLGISDLDNIDPKNIRVYGNGGGMVPMLNSDWRADDLLENAIYVEGEDDGKFNFTDFVLFYGQGPDRWNYTSSDQRFHHQKNNYSDSTYFFINVDKGPGKRIQLQSNSNQNPTSQLTTFDDYRFYEIDKNNLIKSGREWYGDAFDVQPSQDFVFSFPNLTPGSQAYLKTDVAGRSFNGGANGSNFKVSYNNQVIQNINVTSVLNDFTQPYCSVPTANTTALFNPVGQDITLKINFTALYQPANGWLNYLELNVKRNLVFTGSSLFFRDKSSTGIGNYTKFSVTEVPSTGFQIWDITIPWNVLKQDNAYNAGTSSFTVATDTLKQFVMFNASAYKAPEVVGPVENQNLHSLPQADLIIIAHSEFYNEANRLAEFHRNHDTLRVVVATPEQVYNEFSSGAQDVSAIRDFCKMFYDRATATSDLPRYLLLFGDGSYDNKGVLYKSGNYIVTYQSLNSCSPTNSYCSDDFFGLLDDSEGYWNTNEETDLGIGRIPAGSEAQAKLVVDKVISYTTAPGKIIDESACAGNLSPMGDWRNTLTFIADDQDGILHVNTADKLAKRAQADVPVYNIDKIYLDGFQQVSTPGGQRYPSVKDAINKRIEKGSLLINYTGHGGELGWTEERVLEVSDVRSWKNYEKLAVFITATCEFSRYDDPSRTAAGELCLVSGAGGAIGLFTTTRLAYSNTNENINTAMIDSMFTPKNGEMPRLGDIFNSAKRQTANDPGQRNFALLGDPAVRMRYPKYNIVATEINGTNISIANDTLKALSTVTIKGEVRDANGNKLSNFNGVVYPTVYDKVDSLKTLRNDSTGNNQSGLFNYVIQKSVLYKGKASVTNGDFQFTFIVPKDIKYNVGKGRLSFYAQDGFEDAQGYNNTINIGGVNLNAASDSKGPQIKLYLNNDKFVFGGTTNENPSVYAELADSNGINTVGNGIGHDITIQLDNANDKIYTLNDYYQGDLNSYSKGKVIYPLEDLTPGRHTLTLKAWDIYNNSSETYTEFVVSESTKMTLSRVLNYPNPFTTKTSFFFEHNLSCQTLKVDIRIFTVSGKLIKTISQYVNCDGFRQDGVDWDGRDEYGDLIGKGVYLYRLKVSSLNGQSAEKIEKLVILK